MRKTINDSISIRFEINSSFNSSHKINFPTNSKHIKISLYSNAGDKMNLSPELVERLDKTVSDLLNNLKLFDTKLLTIKNKTILADDQPVNILSANQKKIDKLINTIIEISNPKNIKVDEFIDILENEVKKQNNEPNRTNVISLLKRHNYSTNLKKIDFHVLKKTVVERGGEQVKPFWGTDLLKNLDFNGISFSKCKFNYVNLSNSSFANCLFDDCKMTNTVMEQCIFNNTKFNKSNLNDALFDSSKISHTEFTNCSMKHTNFGNCIIHNSTIENSDKGSLEGGNFIFAEIEECNIEGIKLNKPASSINSSSLNYTTTESLPIAALLWKNQRPGTSATKLYESLKSTFNPIKINFSINDIDPEKLDHEIKNILKNIKNPHHQQPIPKQVIEIIKNQRNDYPVAFKLINKGLNIIRQVDTLVLPGGEDIEPEFYGHKRIDQIHKCEPNYIRTLLEFSLVNEAQIRGMPILAICRGAQLVNVFNGGTLKYVLDQLYKTQKLEINKDETSIIRSLAPNSKGNQILGYSEHEHAMDLLPNDLKEIVRYEQVTKGAESQHGAPVVLTQFHPEFANKSGKLNKDLSDSTSFWSFFGDSGTSYRNKKKLLESINVMHPVYLLKKLSDQVHKKSSISLSFRRMIRKLKLAFGKKISQIVSYLSKKFGRVSKIKIVKNPLLRGNETINSQQYEWHLNFALLRTVYEKTQDPLIKSEIRFLIANYLDKAAPDYLNTINRIDPSYDKESFQVSAFAFTHGYQRIQFPYDSYLVNPINRKLAMGKSSPLILTENDEYKKLFPLTFDVVDNIENWTSTVLNAMMVHLYSNRHQLLTDKLKQKLNKNILFDASNQFSSLLNTYAKKQLEDNFKNKFVQFQNTIRNKLELILKTLAKNENLTQNDKLLIKKFIWDNTTFISSAVTDNPDIGGIKILPVLRVFNNTNDVVNKHSALVDFIHHTGVYISSMKARKYLYNVFEIGKNTRFDVKEKPALSHTKLHFLESAQFKRLKSNFSSVEFMNMTPHLYVLGNATLKLLEGLFSEISDEYWMELNQNPAKSEIINFSILNILNQLGNAEINLINFKKFALAIEVIHSNIATLLQITQPYESDDFDKIYVSNLRIIPTHLKDLTKASLTRTATNTFAGVCKAFFEDNLTSAAYSPGFYYEQAGVMPMKKIDSLLEDSSIDRIDLYACQFNPSFEIDPTITGYNSTDIIGNIKTIFKQKPQTKYLTVCVDCTIDYTNSPKIGKLLTEFKKEITEGKLNFVFLKSGQKFDMIGMDNYYGSPCYIINNRGAQWDKINQLLENPSYKADPLSLQWFCLSNKYAAKEIEYYRELIFKNGRTIIDACKDLFTDKKHPQTISLCSIDNNIDPSYIDLKIRDDKWCDIGNQILEKFYKMMHTHNVKVNRKPSFGFYHCNTMMLGEGNCGSIRFNPGIDPSETKLFIKFFHEVCTKRIPILNLSDLDPDISKEK